MTSGSDTVARGVGSATSSDGPCAPDDGFRDLLESFRTFNAEFKRCLRRQTCVILVGFAVMLVAMLTPVYVALFSGGG